MAGPDGVCGGCGTALARSSSIYCVKCGSRTGNLVKRSTEPLPAAAIEVEHPAATRASLTPNPPGRESVPLPTPPVTPSVTAAPGTAPEPPAAQQSRLPAPEPQPDAARTPELFASIGDASGGAGSGRNWMLVAIAGIVVVVAIAAAAGAAYEWWPRAGVLSGAAASPVAPAATPANRPATPAPPADMIYVPGAEFTMGSDSGDEFERPAHKVTVAPFFMSIHEVTCEEYAAFVKATGRTAPPPWTGADPPAGTLKQPVTGVSWEDANAYAAWAGKRLPTEAEWELAARGTDGRKYPWGDDWKADGANVDKKARALVDVGSYPAGASPYGVLDAVGNAWEWTADDPTAYPGGTLPELSGNFGQLKILRGGYSQSGPKEATTTFRKPWPAKTSAPSITYENAGFRCAADAPRAQEATR